MTEDDLRRGRAQGNRDALRVLVRALGPLRVPWEYLRDGPTGSVTNYADDIGVTYVWCQDPRDIPHGEEATAQDRRMDTPTLVGRLRSLADFLDGAEFAVSWLYVDPTPDGPDEAATVHTVEVDGSSAAEVLGNLATMVDGFTHLDHVAAEAQAGRVSFEAVGGTPQDQTIRGTAIVLEPYASPLQTLLGITPLQADDGQPSMRFDLNIGQVRALANDPQMAAGVTPTAPPKVDVPPPSGATSPTGDPSSTPPTSSPTDTPSASPDPGSAVPDPGTAAGTPSSTDSSTPSPTTGDTSSASPDSSVTPSQPSSDNPAPSAGDGSTPSGGTTTPTPDSGAATGGVVVQGTSDAPGPVSSSPSPDPVSTAPVGQTSPPPVATGQQPGTPDGAATNADGTPVEPTAGTTADVGTPGASSGTPSAPNQDPAGAGLPGQTPIDVSSDPIPSGASTDQPAATGAASDGTSSGDSRADEIAALQAQIDALRAQGDGGTVATSAPADGGVQVATNVDPVPDGGQNLADGQGGGATSAAPDSGDGSATGAAGTGPTVVTPDTANPDGF